MNKNVVLTIFECRFCSYFGCEHDCGDVNFTCSKRHWSPTNEQEGYDDIASTCNDFLPGGEILTKQSNDTRIEIIEQTLVCDSYQSRIRNKYPLYTVNKITDLVQQIIHTQYRIKRVENFESSKLNVVTFILSFAIEQHPWETIEGFYRIRTRVWESLDSCWNKASDEALSDGGLESIENNIHALWTFNTSLNRYFGPAIEVASAEYSPYVINILDILDKTLPYPLNKGYMALFLKVFYKHVRDGNVIKRLCGKLCNSQLAQDTTNLTMMINDQSFEIKGINDLEGTYKLVEAIKNDKG